uniref:WGS project CBMI000000000 data, contig CS3069_c004158 n=1 Tax=Fusarium clavum TaxID=2594811 RepID=A0A090N615_9HYPO|nr:unnamed protein product [Fusarium clavum]
MANAYTNNALQDTSFPIFRTGGTALIIIQSQMLAVKGTRLHEKFPTSMKHDSLIKLVTHRLLCCASEVYDDS